MTPAAQDEAKRRMYAAYLVGTRITNGISDADMAVQMGLLTAKDVKKKRAVAAAAAKLRKLEIGLADGRLSTFQHYARGAGLSFTPRLVRRRRPSVIRRARLIRQRRQAFLARNKRPRRHHAL
jgi:hypothetical protein